MPVKSKGTNEEFEKRDLPIKNATYFPVKDAWIIHSLRLHQKRKEALERHFRGQGLTLTTGIRQVLYKYMDEQGIR